jgi:hypothetical protein
MVKGVVDLMKLRIRAMQTIGSLGIFAGLIMTTLGGYASAGGTKLPSYVDSNYFIIGIVALLSGIALCYVSYKPDRLTLASIILGSCTSIIPSILFGTGYNLVAGIVTIVFGYSWLATLFTWLMRGE